MSTKPLTCLTILLFLCVHSAYSNGRFYPGYYIDKNGDSVACTIEYNYWYRNPGSIVVMVGNTKKTLGPADIRRFRVTGYDEYQSASVTYHLNPRGGQDLPLQYSDETATRDCFLRVMIRGTYSLFELTFADRGYFFISEQGGPMRELILRAKTADDVMVLDEQYKSVLSEMMTREHISDQDIVHLKYTPGKLAFVVNRLNQAHGGSQTVAIAPKGPKTKPLRMEIFAGGMLNTFPSTYETVYGTGKMGSTFSPEFGLGLRYNLNRRFSAFSVGLSLGFSTFSAHSTQNGNADTKVLSPGVWYDSTNYSESQTVSNSMLMTNLYVMYTFTQWAKGNLYARVGIDVNYLLNAGDSSGKAYLTSNYTQTSFVHYFGFAPTPDGSGQGSVPLIHLVSRAVCYNFSAGAAFDRQRIELTYCTPMQLARGGRGLSFTMGSFGLTYYYSILK
ncbi:MAG TPA: hypothetical protein VGS79_28810 [Puia sp.]|nr:hypothetical protein [Puia sp.]